MGYVKFTETIGDISKTYEFESYDDFKDWENKREEGLIDSDPQGWIDNTGEKPNLPDNTWVEVVFRSGSKSGQYTEDIVENFRWEKDSQPYDIIHYRVVNE